MLDNLEGAHGIVSPGVVDKVVLQRLIDDAFDFVIGSKK